MLLNQLDCSRKGEKKNYSGNEGNVCETTPSKCHSDTVRDRLPPHAVSV